MIVINWKDFLRQHSDTDLALTIGAFDGVHRGHQVLLERIRRTGYRTAVVTFKNNPKAVLRPSSYYGDLISEKQKLEMFESFGIDLITLIDFSEKFATLSGQSFLSKLKERGDLAYVAIGSDFRCGYGLDTSAREIKGTLENGGITVEIVPPLMEDGSPISSSRIRQAIASGDFVEAAGLLGREVEIDIAGMSSNPGADHESYDIAADGRVSPPDGRYAVELLLSDSKSSGMSCEIDIRSGVLYLPLKTCYDRVRFLRSL